jgi:hypothetical protein
MAFRSGQAGVARDVDQVAVHEVAEIDVEGVDEDPGPAVSVPLAAGEVPGGRGGYEPPLEAAVASGGVMSTAVEPCPRLPRESQVT